LILPFIAVGFWIKISDCNNIVNCKGNTLCRVNRSKFGEDSYPFLVNIHIALISITPIAIAVYVGIRGDPPWALIFGPAKISGVSYLHFHFNVDVTAIGCLGFICGARVFLAMEKAAWHKRSDNNSKRRGHNNRINLHKIRPLGKDQTADNVIGLPCNEINSRARIRCSSNPLKAL